jgi:acyl dehydratase
MRVTADQLLAWPIADVIQTYTDRDTMLYALGLGLGASADPRELRYVYEKGLVAFPTMALVLARPGPWTAHPDLGIDRTKIVHGEQSLHIERPLPPCGTVRGTARVTGVVDKGEDRGALIYVERRLYDDATGDLLAVMSGTSFCRADGGFAESSGPVRQPHSLPQRAPDETLGLTTTRQTALLYRLSGDYNPLHADPEFARRAGFPRPITHGLASYGIAAVGLLKAVCNLDVERLATIEARFAAPTFPGDPMRLRLWKDDDVISFEAVPPAGGPPILTAGKATLKG